MCLKPREVLPEHMRPVDHVLEMIDDLSAAMVNARIYRADHPRVRNSVDSALRFVSDLLRTTNESTLRLSVLDDLVLYQGRPLVGASLTASRLVQVLANLDSGGLEIDRSATAADLHGLLDRLATTRGQDSAWDRVNSDLTESGLRHVRLLPTFVETDANPVSFASGLAAPVRFYRGCLDLLQDVTVAICHGGQLDFGPIHDQAESILRHLECDDAPLVNLARQDQYDAFTFGHSVRVGVLATTFARAMTTDRGLALRVGAAALLHDCGKALVPFEILHSRRPLDDDERLAMNAHAQYGAEILLDHEDADPLAVATAFGHHRSCDGNGYPSTRHEHRNMVVTEMVKICDVYEALTAARPYKQPMTPIRAYRVMISMGEHLDRSLLKRFIHVNGVYPVGQLVELSTGERGSVVAQTIDPLGPRVEVTFDRDGNRVDEQDQRSIDLCSQGGPHGIKITGAVSDQVSLEAASS